MFSSQNSQHASKCTHPFPTPHVLGVILRGAGSQNSPGFFLLLWEGSGAYWSEQGRPDTWVLSPALGREWGAVVGGEGRAGIQDGLGLSSAHGSLGRLWGALNSLRVMETSPSPARRPPAPQQQPPTSPALGSSPPHPVPTDPSPSPHR